MQKFPKHINTKQDVLNLLELYPAKTKAFLQNCIDGYKNFVPVSEHNNKSDCITDDTHDYVTTEEEGVAKYIQREFKVIPGNDLARLGVSLEEAMAMVV